MIANYKIGKKKIDTHGYNEMNIMKIVKMDRHEQLRQQVRLEAVLVDKRAAIAKKLQGEGEPILYSGSIPRTGPRTGTFCSTIGTELAKQGEKIKWENGMIKILSMIGE